MIDAVANQMGEGVRQLFKNRLIELDFLAEVVENMEDGMWVQVKYLEVPKNPGEAGAIELCHAQDIVSVLGSPEGV